MSAPCFHLMGASPKRTCDGACGLDAALSFLFRQAGEYALFVFLRRFAGSNTGAAAVLVDEPCAGARNARRTQRLGGSYKNADDPRFVSQKLQLELLVCLTTRPVVFEIRL
jgi:hypothetical protein